MNSFDNIIIIKKNYDNYKSENDINYDNKNKNNDN